MHRKIQIFSRSPNSNKEAYRLTAAGFGNMALRGTNRTIANSYQQHTDFRNLVVINKDQRFPSIFHLKWYFTSVGLREASSKPSSHVFHSPNLSSGHLPGPFPQIQNAVSLADIQTLAEILSSWEPWLDSVGPPIYELVCMGCTPAPAKELRKRKVQLVKAHERSIFIQITSNHG
jgi:hypothetical protein